MIINNNNNLYVQKIALLYLIESDIPIPESIYKRIKRNSVNDKNKYDFIKFSKPEEITFLNDIPWFIDYDKIKDLSSEDISNMINKLGEKEKILSSTLTPQINEDQLNTFFEVKNIKLKIYFLTEVLWYKYGRTKYNLPKKNRKK